MGTWKFESGNEYQIFQFIHSEKKVRACDQTLNLRCIKIWEVPSCVALALAIEITSRHMNWL